MKAVHVIPVIIVVCVLIACVTTGSKDTVLYENDFSSDNGSLVLAADGERKAEISDGALYLKGGSGEGPAWAGTTLRYGNNSRTDFRIRFGDPVFAHINFLTQEGLSARFLAHIMEDNICFHSIAGGDDLSQSGFEVELVPERWYEFSFVIENYRMTVFIDGEEAGIVDMDTRLPGKGWLTFECHEEYRVDDLRIIELPGAEGDGEERLSTVEEEEIRELLLEWEEAVRTRNPGMLADVLWPEVSFEFHDRKGRRTDFSGIEAVRRFRLDFFEGLGALGDYRLPEPSSFEDHNESAKSYRFTFTGRHIDEWVHANRRGDEWRIQHLELVMPVPGSWVTNRWQALADDNGDGFLQPEERERLFEWTRQFFSGPHPAENPVDLTFDFNRSGDLDAGEIRILATAIFGRGFLWFSRFNPGWAVGQLDLDGDGELADRELEMIRDFMTGGETGMEDIGRDREYFLGNAVAIPFPDAVFQPVPRDVSNYIDELADRNGDGRIDEAEQGVIIASLTRYHDVDNYLEQALDLNHDGKINHSDVLLALQASAMGKRILAADTEPPYPVVTPLDGYLDRNGDGRVDGDELDAAVAFLSGDVSASVSGQFRDMADWNGDGRIDRSDLEGLAGILVQPHPVNSKEPVDTAGDTNGDGFIEPAELGISGGVTEKGMIPTLGDRLRMDRRSAEPEEPSSDTEETGFRSEYYQRLGKIQDRKLAIISLDTQTAQVDEETAAGIIVFVENAFVNVGKVRVVERKNIEEILAEYEFQSSALIDENTAIEIGKLSGADIIVIGSINRVGGVFYLNIKLIDVKTAEIIGSNIAKAKDESEFLDMCNQAVYMLF